MNEVRPHACDDPPSQAQPAAAHDAVLTGTLLPVSTRTVIAASWRRSLAAGVSPAVTAAPLVYDGDQVREALAAHPLGRHLPLLRGLLGGLTDRAEHLAIITDAEGHILWADGPATVRRVGERVGLTEGFCWSEASVGTNGIGIALTSAGPAHVYSAEHLARVLHPWSSAAAPVTDPDSGRIVACVGISALVHELHPATVALVDAAARLTEAHLSLEMRAHDDRMRTRYQRHLDGLGGQSRRSLLTLLTLRLLGPEQPQARIDGRAVALSLRHAEILALLALHPQGLTADQCSYHLYGDRGNPVTLRAEIHRLRAQLGPVVLGKPYRLGCELDADFIAARRSLAAGDLVAAGRLYAGPLLPRSESPTLRTVRDELAAQLRRLLLDRGAADALWAFAQTDSGRDDLEIMSRLTALLPPGDPRCVSARLTQSRLLAPD